MVIAKFFHVISVVVWVGGMFFAYMALRPTLAECLEPPQRLKVWEGVFKRFFPWVWTAVALILSSGLYMMMVMGQAAIHIMIMATLGIIMMLLFAHLYFALFSKLKRAVAAQDWATGGIVLGKIRKFIGLNLALGLIAITVAILGVYLG